MINIDTRAGKVRVAIEGEGAPVVLLHATLHDHHDFDPVIPALSEHFSVIAVDWPGHGESDALPAGVSASGPLFADVLEDVVAGLGLAPAVFVGNSVGGFAAARLAITMPERVAGLVLVNGAGFTSQNVVTRSFCRLLGTPSIARRVLPRIVPSYMKARTDSDRAITSRVVKRSRTRDGAALAASLWRSFATPDYDLRPLVSRLTAPALLTWGTEDTVFPLRAGRATHAAISGSTLKPFSTGHVVFSSDPDGFLTEVLPFLEQALSNDSGRKLAATT